MKFTWRDGTNKVPTAVTDIGKSLAVRKGTDGIAALAIRFDATQFGAVLDGLTDDSAAVQAAIDALPSGGGIVIIPESEDGIALASPVTISSDNVTLIVRCPVKRTAATAGYGIIEIAGSVTATTTTLTASGDVGDTSLTVASISGFAADDWIEIESARTLGGVQCWIDIQQILSVSAGTINLAGALRHEMDISGPTTITVRKLNIVRNSHVIGPATIDHNGQTGDSYLVRTFYGVDCSVRNFKGINHNAAAFRFVRCVGCYGEGLYPEDTVDTSGNGYGVQLYSSHDCEVHSSHGRANRHSFDMACGTTGSLFLGCTAREDASGSFVIGHGQIGRRNRAKHCFAYYAGATLGGAGFSFGNNAYGGDFDSGLEDCWSIGCASFGFIMREDSDELVLTRCHAINCGGQGFRFQDTVGRVTLAYPEARGNATTEINVISGVVGPILIVEPNIYKDSSGIAVELTADKSEVIGGTIKGNGTPSTGVRANGADGVRVIGTHFDNFATRAVQGNDAQELTVLGIRARNVTTGIETSGTSDYATLVGNDLNGLTTPISLVGSNNRYGLNTGDSDGLVIDDPGGSELLRIGGTARFGLSGDLVLQTNGIRMVDTINVLDLDVTTSGGGPVRINRSGSTGDDLAFQVFDAGTSTVHFRVYNDGVVDAPVGPILHSTVRWVVGSGTPEGSVTANVGSIYSRTDGGASTSLYVKESGVGNTGWVAK